MSDDLEILPPHKRPDSLRTCYPGKLTHDEAQAKLNGLHTGAGECPYRVIELRPAKCIGDDDDENGELVEATEVIFQRAS